MGFIFALKSLKNSFNFYYLFSTLFTVLGFIGSVYLTKLFFRANSGDSSVESFCSINKSFDCVSVASSSYSSFLGIPLSVYGMEFYVVLLLVLVSSYLFKSPIKRWESFQFFVCFLAFFVSIILGSISAFLIKSFCVVCFSIYVINFILLLLAFFSSKLSIKELMLQWFFDVRKLIKRSFLFELFFTAILVVLLGQFLFLPKVFSIKNPLNASYSDTSTSKQNEPFIIYPDKPYLIGNLNAPIKVLEFSDYECPFCLKAHIDLLEALKNYPNLFLIRHYDYPLDNKCNPHIKREFHKNSCLSAYYTKCASKQGKFWEYETFVFYNQRNLTKESLEKMASKLGLDVESLKECVNGKEVKEEVLEDIKKLESIFKSASLGVEQIGTPIFVINGKIEGGYKPYFWENLAIKVKTRK